MIAITTQLSCTYKWGWDREPAELHPHHVRSPRPSFPFPEITVHQTRDMPEGGIEGYLWCIKWLQRTSTVQATAYIHL